jgi:hypothetical protein
MFKKPKRDAEAVFLASDEVHTVGAISGLHFGIGRLALVGWKALRALDSR